MPSRRAIRLRAAKLELLELKGTLSAKIAAEGLADTIVVSARTGDSTCNVSNVATPIIGRGGRIMYHFSFRMGAQYTVQGNVLLPYRADRELVRKWIRTKKRILALK